MHGDTFNIEIDASDLAGFEYKEVYITIDGIEFKVVKIVRTSVGNM